MKAILFDLDGVLIETEQETFKFYQEELKKEGVFLKDEDFKYKAGRKSVDFWNDVLSDDEKNRIDTKALVELKRDLFNKHPEKYIRKIPQGKELISNLKNKGYKLALCSQNEAKMINTALEWLEVKELFDEILSIDDIKNLKPNPDIYDLAVSRLQINCGDCVIIEDSKDGIGAAKNAGIKCIALKHPYTVDTDIAEADIVISELLESENHI